MPPPLCKIKVKSLIVFKKGGAARFEVEREYQKVARAPKQFGERSSYP